MGCRGPFVCNKHYQNLALLIALTDVDIELVRAQFDLAIESSLMLLSDHYILELRMDFAKESHRDPKQPCHMPPRGCSKYGRVVPKAAGLHGWVAVLCL
jgi:hypothetical protein